MLQGKSRLGIVNWVDADPLRTCATGTELVLMYIELVGEKSSAQELAPRNTADIPKLSAGFFPR